MKEGQTRLQINSKPSFCRGTIWVAAAVDSRRLNRAMFPLSYRREISGERDCLPEVILARNQADFLLYRVTYG